ncbi:MULTISPECIES: cupin domain-containing protein [Catenuloplanes]|uniref:Quercetin dioxygenase-like cupin family protein n=1 Tax=Catenuloplanes niger TaxID=587534 RepID=A0AAE3ZJX6_9ACTN|nr:hypothetical protein [Catenuloplanes niger]MDR7321273.1 quercetin dioxygenase-like cupin family protein [Catenuloplanes niger]
MTTTRSVHPTDLARDLVAAPYLFVEHELRPGAPVPYRRSPDDHRTFIVIGGRVRLECAPGGGTVREYGYLRGWHALPGAAYRFTALGDEPAVVVEAGTVTGPDEESPEPPASTGACVDVDGYRVDKPWGHEIWYTQNLTAPGYALKQIHMTTGHQSSLQSHRRKVETNYVVEGEATVLNGVPAPDDPGAVVDVRSLPRTVHARRSGWSSAADILHRVIALTDYTSVEVSTPELDDVIRWADDTHRGNGRIGTEHAGARA